MYFQNYIPNYNFKFQIHTCAHTCMQFLLQLVYKIFQSKGESLCVPCSLCRQLLLCHQISCACSRSSCIWNHTVCTHFWLGLLNAVACTYCRFVLSASHALRCDGSFLFFYCRVVCSPSSAYSSSHWDFCS